MRSIFGVFQGAKEWRHSAGWRRQAQTVPPAAPMPSGAHGGVVGKQRRRVLATAIALLTALGIFAAVSVAGAGGSTGAAYGAGHPPIALRCIHDAALGE